MSMRQSLNLESRRKAVADEKEEEAVVENTVPSPKKPSNEKKNAISTNLKVQSSANALTPSKIVKIKILKMMSITSKMEIPTLTLHLRC